MYSEIDIQKLMTFSFMCIVEVYNNGNFEAVNSDLKPAIESVKSYNEILKKQLNCQIIISLRKINQRADV